MTWSWPATASPRSSANAYKDEFGTTMDWRKNKFCWLATTKPLTTSSSSSGKNEHGWWWVHAYRYEEGTTTWIVETSEETWKCGRHGDRPVKAETKAYCEQVFADDLDGHPLITNRSVWRTFPVVRNERLYPQEHRPDGRRGSQRAFQHRFRNQARDGGCHRARRLLRGACGNDVGKALEMYQSVRKDEADRLQRTAVVSLSWFEHIDRYATVQEAEQFTFNMMCRAKRITYENLATARPGLHRRRRSLVCRTHAKETGFDDIDVENPVVPAFQPFRIGDMRVENRFQLSAMCQYCCGRRQCRPTGISMHYGERAIGGAGLLNTEMLCIIAGGRITPGCAGIWSDEQVDNLEAASSTSYTRTAKAKICAQIGHAGRKGATCVPWQRRYRRAAACGCLGNHCALAACPISSTAQCLAK